MKRCPNCGADARDEWEFCETCGARMDAVAGQPAATPTGTAALPVTGAVPAGQSTPPTTEASATRSIEPMPATATSTWTAAPAGASSGSWLARNLWFLIGGALIVVILLLVTMAWMGTRGDLDDVTGELANTEASLLGAESERDSLEIDVGQLEDDLSAADDTIDDLQRKVKGQESTIKQTKTRIELQAGQIDVLRRCLGGIIAALNAPTQQEAINDLVGVQSACEQADKLL
ncbi:MAG: zinc-ribbon domain-containing protein [Actinomycetota bacterium]